MTSEEYNSCVDFYADNLYRFILKNVKDEEEAKDIVQDTYEKLWVKKTEISVEKAKSYMFTAAYHTMIDKIRKNKRQADFSEVNFNTHSHNSHYSDLKEILNKAFEILPDIQKSVVLLRDYEGYSYEEIGEITGLNASQVKVYIYRARVALKGFIGSMEKVI
jgi:RNA polymerase sigma factor (sigma-70 family)